MALRWLTERGRTRPCVEIDGWKQERRWPIVNQRVVGSSSNRGAKPFKYLGASISAKTPLPQSSVGSFVGMLLHNAAQAYIPIANGPTA
jgi:hypothetical protein